MTTDHVTVYRKLKFDMSFSQPLGHVSIAPPLQLIWCLNDHTRNLMLSFTICNPKKNKSVCYAKKIPRLYFFRTYYIPSNLSKQKKLSVPFFFTLKVLFFI